MSEQSVAQFFDSYSADFNALYGTRKNAVNSVVDRIFRKSMRLRFERTIEGCMPIEGKSVVDVGCGPGHYSVRLASRGAASVLGLDFAEGMVRLAQKNATSNGVTDRCEFLCGDFSQYSFGRQFDYSIAMGFMDYIERPAVIIDKILSVTRAKAFFSFPCEGGILAWQRKIRYKKRCSLFLYRVTDLNNLFSSRKCSRFEIEKISRDFFVTVHL
jgi:2-polyprenyl-3-methyl-5-hydroxy-6-metoxy-1,4-benzoquinol methylase